MTFDLSTTLAPSSVDATRQMENVSMEWDDGMADLEEGGGVRVWQPYELVILVSAPILFCVGVPCNILSATVMLRRHYRSTSTGVYLFFLALADSLFLTVNSLTKNFITLLTGVSINTTSDGACKAYVFLLFTAKSLSAWFVVVVTLERLVVVWFPHKVKLISTRRRAWGISAVIIVVISGLMGFLPYFYGLKDSRFGRVACTLIAPDIKPVQTAHKVIDYAIYGVVPFSTLLVSNVLIITRVARGRSFREDSATSPWKTQKEEEEFRRMTVTLLAISFLFLLCTSPMGIYLALSASLDAVRFGPHFLILYYSFYVLQLSNSALNFGLYCLSGPTFRAQLLLLLCAGTRKDGRLAKILNIRASWFGSKYQSQGQDLKNSNSTLSTEDGMNVASISLP